MADSGFHRSADSGFYWSTGEETPGCTPRCISCGVVPWIFSLPSSLSYLYTPPPPSPSFPPLRPLFLTLVFITVVKQDLLAPRQRFL